MAICFCLLVSNVIASDVNEIDKGIAALAGYDYGKNVEPVTKFIDYVRSKYDRPEELKIIEGRFLEFLQSDATFAAKQIVCKQLHVIGTEQSLDVLAEMLKEEKTSDIARFALERMENDKAGMVLRDALKETEGKTKIGIINSIGERRDTKAAADLGELIKSSDIAVAESAIAALGKIANPEAAEILAKAKADVDKKLYQNLLEAYLNCAADFAKQDRQAVAVEIYDELSKDDMPETIRIAALRAKVMLQQEKAIVDIVAAVEGDNEKLKIAAIGLLEEINNPQITQALVMQMPKLSVERQVQLLSLLAGKKGDKAAAEAVVKAVNNENSEISIAAYKTLGSIGNAGHVSILVKAAANSKGQLRDVIRESLYNLPGTEVDEKIVSMLEQSSDDLKIELIPALAERGTKGAVEIILENTGNKNKDIRLASIKALRIVADGNDLPAIINTLIKAEGESELKEFEKTAASVARKIDDRNSRAAAILAVLPSVENIETKAALLTILGKSGDENGFELLRQALEDKQEKIREAAVRGLSEWPDDKPLNDLLNTAQTTDNSLHKILAVRGLINMIGINESRDPNATVDLYKKAMQLSDQAAEKKLVLSGLSKVEDITALDMAADYLGDESLKREAQLAVYKIASRIYEKYPEETKNMLKKILAEVSDSEDAEKVQELILKIDESQNSK
jgi:HEAT repeat protein